MSQHARTRTRAGQQPRQTSACRCIPGPYVMATFRNGDCISIQRMHNRRNQDCRLPAERLDVTAYREGRIR